MPAPAIRIVLDKSVTPAEFATLMAAVGAGKAEDYSIPAIERSLAAYPFVAHARDAAGRLVGYVSAFCDGAFSTFVGEIAVHPDRQRQGIGRQLLQAVETYANGVPVYVNPFADHEEAFLRIGYRRARRPSTVLFKRTKSA
ncbi:MAG: GNAT family N-acetyltransferase [Planctomycetes bacterium]|nr:GNAT family N-acetyltransferase [Planctomycetota bacterium]